jgi:hypothetical protein
MSHILPHSPDTSIPLSYLSLVRWKNLSQLSMFWFAESDPAALTRR